MELIQPIKVDDSKKRLSLTDFRIKSTDDIDADVYLTKIGNTNKLSRSNISAWTGMAKSRKTFALTMVVSSMLAGSDIYGQFKSYNRCRVLWIDTEQSPYDVQKVVRRTVKMSGSEDSLFMYGLRPLSPAERIMMIDQALKNHECDVLVIDGARDLLTDINNAEQSTEIVTKLMKWSYDYNIHVATVVHSSYGSSKVRGHIGSELENKAETVIKVQVNEDDKERSDIIEIRGRGKGFGDIGFKVNDDGIPEVIDMDMIDNAITALPGGDDIPF